MRLAALLLIALVACAGPDFTPPTAGGDPTIAPVVVSGFVFDSVTQARITGVRVGMGGVFAVTDDEGAFVLSVPPGENSVHVAASGYEPLATTVTVGEQTSFELPLRRLAPFPVSCQLAADGFHAVIVDLQGRKSLERWSQSTLTLVTPTLQRTIGALSWKYQGLDYLRWEVTIPDADPATVRVDWTLYDSQGDAYRGSCEPVTVVADSAGA